MAARALLELWNSRITGGVHIHVRGIGRAEHELGVLRRQVHARYVQQDLGHLLAGAPKVTVQAQVRAPGTLAGRHFPPAWSDRAARVGIYELGPVLDRARGRMVVLGEPGAGKTVALLHLAEELIRRTEGDEVQPVPLVFELATWRSRGRQPDLAEWLVSQFKKEWGIGRADAHMWMERGRVALLLDGLDELPPEERDACVLAIHALTNAWGAIPVVVSCRTETFRELAQPLQSGAVVEVQPLRDAEVLDVLTREGLALAGLRQAWHSSETLRALSRAPLMLTQMVRAYHDLPAGDAAFKRLDDPHTAATVVFETYIRRMLASEPGAAHIRQVLVWLAQRLRADGQQAFLFEHLQPSWLPRFALAGRALQPEAGWRLLYLGLSRTAAGMFVGVLFGLLGAPIPELRANLSVEAWVAWCAASGTLCGLLHGVLDAREWTGRGGGARTPLQRFLASVQVAGGIMILPILPTVYQPVPEEPVLLAPWLVITSLLLGTLLRGRLSTATWSSDIRTVEELRWSWREAWPHLRRVAIALVLLYLVLPATGYFLISAAAVTGTAPVWAQAVVMALGLSSLGVVGVLVISGHGVTLGGLRGRVRTGKVRINEGMRRTMRSALLAAVISVLSMTGFFILIHLCKHLWGSDEPWFNAQDLILVVMGTVLAVARFGGVDVLSHLVLRGVLHLST